MTHYTAKALFFLLLLIISGCAAIEKSEAEEKAIKFVDEKVKFFAREKNSTLNLPQYEISGITSYEDNKYWVVVLHVSANTSGDAKTNDLVVKMDKKGKIFEFNGKEIPKQFRE